MNFEWLQKLYAAANEAQRQRMGLYSEGPFTRVWFVYRRGDIELIRNAHPDTKGVSVHCISNKG